MVRDPITLNIVSRAFTAISEEMGSNLRRAAYSSIIREALDYSTALLDANGKLVAQAARIPIHLLTMPSAFAGCAKKHDIESVKPGEALITNDPYNGAQHLPDIFIFTPIWHGDSLIGFTGTTGHHKDVGGAGVGSMSSTVTDIFGEGIRIPSLKISLSRDLEGGLFEQIFASNIRNPEETVGDLYAQIIANRTGEQRMLELVEKYGRDTIVECMQGIMDYSERLTREEIVKIPNGTYQGEDFLDSDVEGGPPLKILATVTISDDDIHVGFEGSSPQAKGPINAPFAATMSAVQTAVKAILTDQTVPPNSGCFAPVRITAPYGSLVNPRPPAPCRARINAACRVFGAVMKAFSHALPDTVVANGFETTTSINISRVIGESWRIFGEPLRSGYGASSRNDGVDMVSTSMSNCSNTPVEAAETDHDWFRIRRYELIQDSGGPGKFRGGFGARREYELLADEVYFNSFGDRHKLRPWGLFGGHPGTLGRIVVQRGNEEIRLKPLDHFVFRAGDVLVVETGGGGGYGDPKERDRESLASDLRDERISIESAHRDYGLDESSVAEVTDGQQVTA